jgi:predicted aminopeptidase
MATYLGQAAQGQAALWWNARAISDVIRDPATDQRTRDLLQQVAAIKAFGQAHGLTPTQSYSHYVDVKRPAVCWVVSASPPLELRARTWEFPVIGSFPYLGWFSEKDARHHAESLRGDGWDVDVRPVSAYSTLGILRDSVLSTMVANGRDSLADLANVVFHESVHATLHVPGQGTFNESLADFVADGLTPLWLATALGEHSREALAWQEADTRGRQRVRQLHNSTVALEALYAAPIPEAQRLEAKWKIIAALKADLGTTRSINNATLMQYRTYDTGKDAFAAVLETCGGDHARLLQLLQRRAPGMFRRDQERDLGSVLEALVATGCR